MPRTTGVQTRACQTVPMTVPFATSDRSSVGLEWELMLADTATGDLVTLDPGPVARIYVCGITPYDATHIGHAATYNAFDLVQRVWLDTKRQVHYVQNVTDVDDPLLERAEQTGVAWQSLAEREIELFRTDMEALRILPPREYVGVTEVIDRVAGLITELAANDITRAVAPQP